MSKTITIQRHSPQEVLNWLDNEVKKTQQKVKVHQELIKEDGDYLHVPIHVPDKDAFGVAHFLQEIEDKWNDQEPELLPRLLLVPTKD
jgi:hypothetical protein